MFCNGDAKLTAAVTQILAEMAGSLTLGYILSFFVIKYSMYTGSIPTEEIL